MIQDYLRLEIFLITILVFGLWEQFFPKRKILINRFIRWPGNIFLIVIFIIFKKIILPMGLIGIGQTLSRNNFGLFNIISLNIYIEMIISILLFDFFIWAQHLLMHKVDFLWRLHRVHHSDPVLDTSSSIRFHPLEFILSYVFKIIFIILFGFSVEAILIFEVLLSSFSIMTHANILINKRFEKILGMLFITPSMHIVHHLKADQSKNFGFCLSLWDRAFKSFSDGCDINKEIGLEYFDNHSKQGIWDLLKQPFVNYKQ